MVWKRHRRSASALSLTLQRASHMSWAMDRLGRCGKTQCVRICTIPIYTVPPMACAYSCSKADLLYGICYHTMSHVFKCNMQVLLGEWDDELVAVKVVRQECTQHTLDSKREEYCQKAEKLQAMTSPYIVRFHGACYDHKQVR